MKILAIRLKNLARWPGRSKLISLLNRWPVPVCLRLPARPAQVKVLCSTPCAWRCSAPCRA